MVWLLVWLLLIFIEVVHILYNDCLWYDCWFGFFLFFLRWFIFCTMIAHGVWMIADMAFSIFYWGGSYFVQWLPMVCGWLLVWRFQFLLRWFIFCTIMPMIAGLALINFYWGGSYFVQRLPLVCGWLLVWLFSIFIEVVHILYNDCLWCVDDCWFGFFQFLLRWFIFCTMIAYGMIAGMAFSIFIEVVHILYNYAYGMIAGLAFINFHWGGSYFVQWLPMVCKWLLMWRFQFLLRWFIFCTMIAYGVIAGLAFFNFLLRWFIFCTMIAYGMIAGLAFSIFIEVVHILYNDCLWYDCWYGVFNFYWGGSYFVQLCLWYDCWFGFFQFLLRWFMFRTMIAYGVLMIADMAFSIFIEVVHILYNDCPWCVDDCWYGVFNFYWGGLYFVQLCLWLLVWLLSIFIEVVHIWYNYAYDCWFGFYQFLLRWFIFCTTIAFGVWMIAGLAFINFYWGGSYFVQRLPLVCGWLLVWLFSIFIEVVHILYNDCLWCVDDCWYGFFQFLLRWFIFCTMIAYGMIAGMAFSIFIEVVHILYNYAYGMIAGLAFINFYWGGSYFVQWLPMVCKWLLMWRFQFLLRWFIFCTMIAYGMIAGMAFSIFIEVVHILYNYAYGMIAGLAFINFYWGGSYFVQWLPMVCKWLLMWCFQFLLRWFIFCTMNAYGVIAGMVFSIFIEVVHILYNDCLWYDCWYGVFNFYWGGLYFVQWLPIVWLLVWLFSIFIEVVHILHNDCLWYDCWYGVFNFYSGGSYFVQWLPMVWLLVWRFQFLLRWFIFCTMIAYSMIAGLAFFNFYRGGSYFAQWLPMVWLLVWCFQFLLRWFIFCTMIAHGV